MCSFVKNKDNFICHELHQIYSYFFIKKSILQYKRWIREDDNDQFGFRPILFNYISKMSLEISIHTQKY